MPIPSIDILYITHNRLAYTRKTLPALIENAGVPFRLSIFDNGSTDGTVEYLQEIQDTNKNTVTSLFFNAENIGIAMPTNIFWKKSQADYLGKVDNDTLLPENWLRRLLEAHQKSDKFGIVGGFHFNMGYFQPGELEGRVISVDGVELIPDAFIGGCCYLMPRALQRELGFMAVRPGKKTFGWTEYQRLCLRAGRINGYLYPLLPVEHFDDPLSEHNLLFSNFMEISKISLTDKGILPNRESMRQWYAKDAARLVDGESLRIDGAAHLLTLKQKENEPLKAILSDAELGLFLSCSPSGGTVLEFGTGGSTRLYMEKGVRRLYSVESDPEWLERMKRDPIIRESLANGRLSFFHANIGSTAAYGLPADPTPSLSWLNYHRTIWDRVSAHEVDHILIDGRFRVACGLQCLLRCREDTSIYIHDFNDRPHYHVLLEFLDIISSADTAILCKAKKNINIKRLALVLQQYDFDQR